MQMFATFVISMPETFDFEVPYLVGVNEYFLTAHRNYSPFICH